MRATLETLVAVAESYGESKASEGRWWACRSYDDFTGDMTITVGHHATVMLNVTDGVVVPLSKGWGSMTDKQGIRKVLKNVTGQGYAEVYAGFEVAS